MDKILEFVEKFGDNIIKFLLVLIFGLLIVKFVIFISKKLLFKTPLDNTVISFIMSIIKFGLYFGFIIVLVDMLDIATGSLIAILGTAGLAFSLAMQGSLSNLASGIVIIVTKPFKEGDFVDIDGVSGSIKAIKMLNTELLTTDNKKIIIPNSKISSGNVINFNSNATRRLDMVIGVSFDSDIDEVKDIIKELIDMHPLILKTPEPIVRMKEMGASSLNFDIKLHTLTQDHFTVKYDLTEEIFKTFKNRNIEVPYQKVDVNIINKVKDENEK